MSGFMQLQVRRIDLTDLVEMDKHELDQEGSIDPSWYDKVRQQGFIWSARYSAPGYMDRTDACFSDKGPIDAAYAAFDLFGDEAPHSEDRKELATIIREARAQGWRK
jgi:hypothetical protein